MPLRYSQRVSTQWNSLCSCMGIARFSCSRWAVKRTQPVVPSVRVEWISRARKWVAVQKSLRS